MESTHLDALVACLDRAWRGGFKTKSDFAREHAPVVAMATDRNLITTRVGPNTYGDYHYVTPQGLQVLWSLKGIRT